MFVNYLYKKNKYNKLKLGLEKTKKDANKRWIFAIVKIILKSKRSKTTEKFSI